MGSDAEAILLDLSLHLQVRPEQLTQLQISAAAGGVRAYAYTVKGDSRLHWLEVAKELDKISELDERSISRLENLAGTDPELLSL